MKMKTKCPYCGYIADRHETMDDEKKPTDNDVGFCINCGEVSEFKNSKLIKIDLDSLDESIKQEINDIRIAWLRTKVLSKVQK